MKNKFRFYTFAVCLAVAAFTFGCQNAANNGNASNNAAVAANIPVNQNANKPADSNTAAANTNSGGPAGSLATPTEAYKTAYEIRQGKDGPALKKIMSKDMLEFFAEMGKINNKSLDEMLIELVSKPQGPTNETRNEKITGDRAVLEYKNEKGEWKEMDFVKEGGDWKLTIPKMDGPAGGPGAPPKKR